MGPSQGLRNHKKVPRSTLLRRLELSRTEQNDLRRQ